MELILLLKQEKYFGESFELKSREELLEKLKEISYINNNNFDEYEVQKIVRDKEVNEKLNFSIHVEDNGKMYSVEEYLNQKR